MNPTKSSTRGRKPPGGDILPLEPGDSLTREEFERRYEAMPHVKKAELIEGVVYRPSPVRHERHSRPHAQLAWWLVNYELATSGVETGDNGTTRLDPANQPQPDLLLLISPECGGQSRISADDYLEAAPELVAEVAASTASVDLHTKFETYRRSGVQEYIVWRVLDREVDWFLLRDGQYERLASNDEDVLRSRVFPGLRLDPQALVGGDLARVLAVLQQGLASPQHAEFVDRLRRASEAS